MLVGRKVGGGSVATTVSPSNATITISGYAPDSEVTVDTLFLNYFNGGDGSQTFTDEIPGVTWTAGGDANAEKDTAVKKFGTASLRLPDNGAIPTDLHTSSISSFTSSTDAWTLEGWVYETAALNVQILDGSVGGQLNYTLNATQASLQGTTATISFATANWYHWAVVWDGSSTLSGYFDGNRAVTHSTPGAWTVIMLRGAPGGGDIHFDSARLTKAILYSGATYTIPTAEF